jgi:putative addiction module component (TIGR02574 family)
MTAETKAIFDAALALPEAERATLVKRLLASLPSDVELGELTDDEFVGELNRRYEEVEKGLVKPIPWEEFRLDE